MTFSSPFEGMTIFEAFCNATKNYGSKTKHIEDASGASLTFKQMMIGVRAMANKLEPELKAKQHVGLMLPNAAGAIVSILALHSLDCVPAMLNFTAGSAVMLSSCKTGNIRTVLTSRRFVEKGHLEELITALEGDGIKIVWLEDVKQNIGLLDKIRAAISSLKSVRPSATPHDPAVILFTSGSEGLPKGVVLSHQNILSNCAQVGERISFSNKTDKVFTALPLFHSLGMTGGMVMPLVYGVPLYLYPSPLHYKIICKTVKKTKSTILFGTDTFLAGYARVAKDEDFASVRIVVAGAEPVKMHTVETWKERFDVIVLEGFGMTEASPVVAVNSVEENRFGTVGKVLPGMEAKIEPVEGIDEGGKLYIKGPNLMLGYLSPDNPGVLQPMQDEWHDSGDICAIDDDGYVAIKGRMKRFAKIAGEMVPLPMVEKLATQLALDDEHAVVALPDKRKGEKIILLTTSPSIERKDMSAVVKEQGHSEFLVPAKIVVIPEIPLLGSGKTDYTKAKEIAEHEA